MQLRTAHRAKEAPRKQMQKLLEAKIAAEQGAEVPAGVAQVDERDILAIQQSAMPSSSLGCRQMISGEA